MFKRESRDDSDSFFIEEYNQSWNNLRHNVEKRQKYQNFLILLVVAFIGLIAALTNIFILDYADSNINLVEVLIPITILFISFYATVLYKIEIRARKEIVESFWQINDIRRYFLKSISDIEKRKHLHLETTNFPRFYSPEGECLKSLFIVRAIISFLYGLFGFFVTSLIIDIFIKKQSFKSLEKIECISFPFVLQIAVFSVIVITTMVALRYCNRLGIEKILFDFERKTRSKISEIQENYTDESLDNFFVNVTERKKFTEGIRLIEPKIKESINERRTYIFDKKDKMIDTVITESNKKHTQKRHRHKRNFEKHIVLEGEIIAHYDGNSIRLVKGQCIIIPPSSCRKIEFPSNEYTRIITIKCIDIITTAGKKDDKTNCWSQELT